MCSLIFLRATYSRHSAAYRTTHGTTQRNHTMGLNIVVNPHGSCWFTNTQVRKAETESAFAVPLPSTHEFEGSGRHTWGGGWRKEREMIKFEMKMQSPKQTTKPYLLSCNLLHFSDRTLYWKWIMHMLSSLVGIS